MRKYQIKAVSFVLFSLFLTSSAHSRSGPDLNPEEEGHPAAPAQAVPVPDENANIPHGFAGNLFPFLVGQNFSPYDQISINIQELAQSTK